MWPWPWLFSMRKEDCTKEAVSRTQCSSPTSYIPSRPGSLCSWPLSPQPQPTVPRLRAPRGTKLLSLCFQKAMDRVSSPAVSVEWSLLGWKASGNDNCPNEVFTRISCVESITWKERKKEKKTEGEDKSTWNDELKLLPHLLGLPI